MTRLFIFCICFIFLLPIFVLFCFVCVVAKLRHTLHESSANAQGRMQKCMRRARGLQQRMQQKQLEEEKEQKQPLRYLLLAAVVCVCVCALQEPRTQEEETCILP